MAISLISDRRGFNAAPPGACGVRRASVPPLPAAGAAAAAAPSAAVGGDGVGVGGGGGGDSTPFGNAESREILMQATLNAVWSMLAHRMATIGAESALPALAAASEATRRALAAERACGADAGTGSKESKASASAAREQELTLKLAAAVEAERAAEAEELTLREAGAMLHRVLRRSNDSHFLIVSACGALGALPHRSLPRGVCATVADALEPAYNSLDSH